MREALLQEREKILKELESVENVLIARYGWKAKGGSSEEPQAEKPAVVTTPVTSSPSRFYGGGEAHSLPPIKYSDEFRDWLESRRGVFTVNDFRDDLFEKHGKNRVNENSLRTPFRTAENSGDIIVVSQGSGRKATVYSCKNYLPPKPDTEDEAFPI